MANILVIDDDPDIRVLVRKSLALEGHVIFEAGNGEEGVEVLNDGAIDLIITDIFMPEMDGFELISEVMNGRLHRQEKFKSIKIIAITGGQKLMDSHHMVRMARMFGVHDTMIKPFDRLDIRRKVAQLLKVPVT
ncbi:MAG: response regulator [Magnetococcales bacterium]|nr:response regulator [Magnetococcales bacterium]